MVRNSGEDGEMRMSVGKALALWLVASLAGWALVMLLMHLFDMA
ncbi:MAG: hypothetical protein Tsb008_13490 [Rhodothalassiaceae bacterium]